jgi:hypothetical protein
MPSTEAPLMLTVRPLHLLCTASFGDVCRHSMVALFVLRPLSCSYLCRTVQCCASCRPICMTC